MGAYSHARARAFVFGGMTRYMLEKAPVPLLRGRKPVPARAWRGCELIAVNILGRAGGYDRGR
jgi:hypothetical protein